MHESNRLKDGKGRSRYIACCIAIFAVLYIIILLLAMEMVEIDGQSVGGDILQDTKSQFKNEDSVSDTNLHQLTNNSPDIIGKETVKRSCTKTHCRTALLVCVIIIVIGVIMQIPVILFATAPSSDGMINPLDVVDFKSCSVSYIATCI